MRGVEVHLMVVEYTVTFVALTLLHMHECGLCEMSRSAVWKFFSAWRVITLHCVHLP